MIGECFEVAVLCYPMFACLTTRYKVIGSIMGFLYTGTWYVYGYYIMMTKRGVTRLGIMPTCRVLKDYL